MKRLLSTSITLIVLAGAVLAATLQPAEQLALHHGSVQVASEDLFADADAGSRPQVLP